MKKEILRLENITYSIEGTGLLNNISLRIFENEVFCILGLNNSGKSFLADYISGSLCADYGKAYYMGTQLIPSDCLSKISQDMFLINVNTRPPANITFSEYLYILSGKQAPFFYNRKSTVGIARELLRSMGVAIDAEKNIGSFSPGTQHVMMILGAHFSKKKLIIIDCITDAYSKNDIDLLKYTVEKVKASGMTILFFTRKYDIAKTFGERTALMKKGRIVKILDSPEVYDRQTIYSSLSEKNDYNFCRKHLVHKDSGITISNLIPQYDISTHVGEIVGILDSTNQISRRITKLIDEASLEFPISGAIGDNSFKFSTVVDAVKQKIGIIFDPYRDSATFDNLSIQDNLSILKMSKLRYRHSKLFSLKHQKILLDDFGLYQHREANHFSGDASPFGSYASRQIAFKKWLVFQPALLICLNPFAHLDFENKEFFCQLLDEIAQNGTCILIISDDPSIINNIFDQVIYTNKNETISYEIIDSKDLSRVSPTMDF